MNINIGDVFYMIEVCDRIPFYTKCRVCEGKKEITVNGITFRCPKCNDEKILLCIYGYKVVRYKVYSIETSMPNEDWKTSDIRNIKYGLFHKHGKGHYIGNTKTIQRSDYGFSEKFLNNPNVKNRHYADKIYSDYKLAVKCADELTQESINELKRYNEKYGTNFEIPILKIEHDKKSK